MRLQGRSPGNEDTAEKAVEEKGRREELRDAAWEPRGREGSPPFVGRGTDRGEVNFATRRDRRRRKSSSPLSRLSFIDTRGFVFQSRHETRRRVVRV